MIINAIRIFLHHKSHIGDKKIESLFNSLIDFQHGNHHYQLYFIHFKISRHFIISLILCKIVEWQITRAIATIWKFSIIENFTLNNKIFWKNTTKIRTLLMRLKFENLEIINQKNFFLKKSWKNFQTIEPILDKKD